MLPARQRLEADDLAVDAGLRLIIDHQLALLDGGAKIVQERAALAQALIHVGLEEADRPASFGLGPVERGIGVGEERRPVHAVDRIERDPHAEPDAQAMPLDLELVGDGGEEPLGQPRGVGRSRAFGHDHGELVAAEAGEERALERRAQALRDRAQEPVAGRMTEDVVDLLEPVEIHEQNGEALVRFRRPFEHRGEALIECRPVGQIGERIVMSQPRDARLRALSLGDVLGDGQ